MSITQTIPRTQRVGTQIYNLTNTAQPWSNALLTINRATAGGLNSLAATETLQVSIDYSTDGGASWLNVAGFTLPGGTYVTKGVTQTEDILGVGIGKPFPTGTAFRVNTVASVPVFIAGSVVYS